MRGGAIALVLSTVAAGCAPGAGAAPTIASVGDDPAVAIFRAHCVPKLVHGFPGFDESEVWVGETLVVVQPSERTCEVMARRGPDRVPAAVIEAVERQLSPELTRLGFRRIKKTAEYPPVTAFAKAQPKGGCAVVIAAAAHDEDGGLLILTAGVAPAPNLPTLIECPSI